MKILTVGDSFTYGEELADQQTAWPYLLAQQLSADVDNLAKPGSGNKRMVRTVVELADNYDIIIVAWSHFARIESADAQGIFDVWPGSNQNVWQGSTVHRRELVKYMTVNYDDQYLYTDYLLNIILLQRYLESKNKQYVMLDSFNNNNFRHLNVALSAQVNAKTFLGWSRETMMEWTYGTAKGPNGHFLEAGHQLVADKIYEHIRN